MVMIKLMMTATIMILVIVLFGLGTMMVVL